MTEVQTLTAQLSFEEFLEQSNFTLWRIVDIYDHFYQHCMLRGLRPGYYRSYAGDIRLYESSNGMKFLVDEIYGMVEEVSKKGWYKLALEEPIFMYGLTGKDGICNQANITLEMPTNLDFMSSNLTTYLNKLNYLLYLMQYGDGGKWHDHITHYASYRFPKTNIVWNEADKPQNIIDCYVAMKEQMPTNEYSAYNYFIETSPVTMYYAFKWQGHFYCYQPNTDDPTLAGNKWYYDDGFNYGSTYKGYKGVYAYSHLHCDNPINLGSELNGKKILWKIDDDETFYGIPFGYDFKLSVLEDKTAVDPNGIGYGILSFESTFDKILYDVPFTNFANR